MDIQVGNVANLQWLWLLALVAAVLAVAAVLRRRALARFATANLIGQLIPAGGRVRRVAKAVLVLASLAAMVLALIDVRWGKTWRDVPQKGVEVMFVLDVSRSMLAQDAAPNRLDRAKQQINDMVDAMTGDRVGLVVFAGDARRRIPLTSHHNDFKQTLAEVGPQDVARGGSRLGDAIQAAADSFLNKTTDHKAIVLFTDGEDMESDPIKQAQKVHQERGVRIFTVGLGDATQGERIPVSTSRGERSYLQYNGQQVWSKMNGQVLRQIAADTDGAYIPAGTKQVDMANVYRNYIAGVEQQEFETARVNSYIPRYQWFVGAALLLLLLDTVIGYGQRAVAGLPTEPRATTEGLRRPGKRSPHPDRLPSSSLTASLSIAAVCLLTASASATDVSDMVRLGNEALAAGKFDEALATYQQAAATEPTRAELLYNQAVAHYRKGEYEQARGLFTQATSSGDRQLEAKARFNLADCDYAEAVALAEKDKPAAIERLNRAISHYRGALQSNPAEGDARANIELAQMLIKKLQEEEKQDQQKQDQQQDEQKQDQEKQEQEQEKQEDKQQQDQQKQDQQKSDEQKQDEQKSGEPKEDEQKQDQQKQEQEKQKEQKQDQQKQDQQKSGDTKEDQENQDQQKSDEQQQDQQKQEQQKQDEQQQDQQKSGEQKEDQQPQKDQQQAGQAQTADQDQQPQGAPQYSGESAAEQEARPMTKEEAQKMLQAVRDRDLMRRLEQLEQRRSRHVPVDKDW
jgi:Ca-activated chloride channel family protein